jgi:hypothetical protein
MSEFGTLVKDIINDSMANSARSEFAQTKLGVSDVGYCREYARRVIVGAPRDRRQKKYLAAFVGTAVGALIEKEFINRFPYSLIQMAVTVELKVDQFLLKIPGHPDLVMPKDKGNRIVDFKTQDGLGVARSTGADDQQKFQVSLYAKSLIEEGVLDENCICTVAFIDRSGSEDEVVVDEWKYDPDLVLQAEGWLEDVIYAVINEEAASKDKPRSWCWAVCDFAPSCRGGDSDVEGLIEDPIVLDAIKVYNEAKGIIKQAEKDKKSAASVLANIEGRTPEHTIRWVSIPGGSVAYERQGYSRLDVTPNRSK